MSAVDNIYQAKLAEINSRLQERVSMVLSRQQDFKNILQNAQPEDLEQSQAASDESSVSAEQVGSLQALNPSDLSNYHVLQSLTNSESSSDNNGNINSSLLSSYLGSFNPYLSSTGQSSQYDFLIQAAAKQHGIDANLLKAVIKAESNFNASSVSSAGAQGLMQLMPETAAALGVGDPFEPQQNILGGAQYLSQLLKRFNGDIALALAAYNYGPGRVEKLNITDSGNAEQMAQLPESVNNYIDKVLLYAANY